MSHLDLYVIAVCVLVYVALTALSTWMITIITRLRIKVIRLGVEDERIAKEYRTRKSLVLVLWNLVDRIVSVILLAAVGAFFAFSVYMRATQDKSPNGVPSLKIVRTSSMAKANPENKYLEENNITNRLQVFDIIVTRHLPDEYELELYDIVMYEVDDQLIIHRIVGIEEPNEQHPNCRYFVLQGDALSRPDRIPVYYSQMRGIYTGERIPFVGSFILFMQSPAGYLCILLILIAMVSAPLVDRKIQKEKERRLASMGLLDRYHYGNGNRYGSNERYGSYNTGKVDVPPDTTEADVYLGGGSGGGV